VRKATRPSSVSTKRSSRGAAPVAEWTIFSTKVVSRSTVVPRAGSASGSRCVCTETTSGMDSVIACSTSLATVCASSSGRSPGNFRWSETSAPPSVRRTVRLWISRTSGTLCALAERRLVLLRLHVDDDVALRERPVHRLLDRIRGSVTLGDRGAGRDADDDVRELSAGGLAHPQPP